MAGYDSYDREYSRRYVRDDRDSRYLDAHDYAKPYPSSRELVPREGGDQLAVRRRARSAEPGYYEADYGGYDARYDRGYDRAYDGDYDRDYGRDYRSRHDYRRSAYYDDQRSPRHKSVSKQDKLIAAVAGAALLVGSKELYDRHEAKADGTDVQRNPLSSAALAGFGALAGYQGAEFYSKQQAKKDQTANYILHRDQRRYYDDDGYYYDDQDDVDLGPKEKKGHRNFLESAIAATGLGAAVKSLTAAANDDGRSVDSRSRSRGPTGSNKIQKAAMASLLAGATEAFRVAKEPGGWKGEKTKRVLTAAAGAATVDAAQGDSHGGLGLAESVIGGLLGNRLINGSKKDIEEDRLTGRSRSRSRARSRSHAGAGAPSGLAALATAGLGALGAKKVLDRPRSPSRGRGGYDSRSPSVDGRRHRSRSRSVVDKARNSLAKLGIGSGAEPAVVDDVHHHHHRRRDHDDFSDDRAASRRSARHSDLVYDDDDDSSSRYGRSRDYDRRRHRASSRSGYGSASDLGDSDQDEKKARKMRGKQVLTTGLATVATIHAAHGVYQSMEKRRARQRAVDEGRLSSVEAKRLKTKAMIQDAASVGIAVLGIKGAMGEMEEAKEATHECKAFKEEKARRHERREARRRSLQRHGDDYQYQYRRADSVPARAPLDDVVYGPRYWDDMPASADGRGG
ncbi:hypothetical protein CDD80_1007 [Ophiocordyceps camponoti-rufipedis]|uniref:DUF3824 domain-containing protein n=1 Tax=Ophiocordyceps camponoti-rufipedis TaxID=2004952 RepID=A0A2C5YEA7_9HYPO|nr:hypothetical protein CDD80_1007 [Ophiocordyceps camponoti-rufipedis]